METIVFASNNAHKLAEIRAILGDEFEIKSLKEIGCNVDLPETADSFEGNALQKAEYVKEHYGLDCFADDSGLEVDALDGAPGIYSARYAQISGMSAEAHDNDANMDCLLAKLEGVDNSMLDSHRGTSIAPLSLSAAQFRTCVALIYKGETHYFDGIVRGTIINEKRGSHGFGYDPLFVPEGYEDTFAELGDDIKNGISHRARAVSKLAEFLLRT